MSTSGNPGGREELLLKMYDQMFGDINRHILVIWQSVGVVVGAFALLALAEKNVLPLDIAIALIVILAGWVVAHVYDGAYWYNRNLVIIANIERQFLRPSDLRDIHYYFGAHRPTNKPITHLRLQSGLAAGVGALLLAYHFFERVAPGVGAPWGSLQASRVLPYGSAVVAVVWVLRVRAHRNASYLEFIKNSPGVSVDASGIEFGIGHGFPEPKRSQDLNDPQ